MDTSSIALEPRFFATSQCVYGSKCKCYVAPYRQVLLYTWSSVCWSQAFSYFLRAICSDLCSLMCVHDVQN